jgi:hypothetical protein
LPSRSCRGRQRRTPGRRRSGRATGRRSAAARSRRQCSPAQHLCADRPPLAVEDDGQRHLFEVRPVVLGMAVGASVSPPSPANDSVVVSMNTTDSSLNRSRRRSGTAQRSGRCLSIRRSAEPATWRRSSGMPMLWRGADPSMMSCELSGRCGCSNDGGAHAFPPQPE